MPQGDRPGQPWDTGQQPGSTAPPQFGASPYGATQTDSDAPFDGGASYGQAPPMGAPGPSAGAGEYGPPMSAPPMSGGSMHGRPRSPVSELATHVTGKRVVQYIIDAIIVGVVAGVLDLLLNRSGGGLRAVYVILTVVWSFFYWAVLPHLRNGQTPGMQVMSLRVISKDGGPASLGQFFGRAILLVIFPVISLLVGFITMLCSPYRQRVGDHLAKTIVVSTQDVPR